MHSNSGSCLCGKVKFTTQNTSESVGACHCGNCKKWLGGPSIAVDCGTDITIEGEENITRYDSTEWCQRCFCKNCGSAVFYYIKEAQQYFVLAGAFEDQSQFKFDHQIFIDQKAKYYSFSNDTHNMTGEEFYAAVNG